MATSIQPWAETPDVLIKRLQASSEGLSTKESESRLIKHGKNVFHSKEKISTLYLFLKQFLSPLIFLLIGASILTTLLSELLDTIVILFAVLIDVVLGFYHEYHAENTLEELTTYIKDRSKVIRDGKETEIDSSLIVPGDVIKLSYGVRIPADARIITLNNFRTDEAILTGESLPIEKEERIYSADTPLAERKNIAHAGTLVVQGYATAVVYATGNNTEIGKIAGIVSKTRRSETPLQKGIDNLAWLIFFVVVLIVLGILILGVYRGEPLLPMIILAAAVAVGAVPEALPIALTVILAKGALRIASRKGIVRKLAAAETLGSTTLIMTDKTGTLTLGDMELVGIHDVASVLSDDPEKLQNKNFSAEQKNLLKLALSNVDVSIENPHASREEWVFRGRPFEVNIVKACRLHNISLDGIQSSTSSLVLPFNSTNKFSVAEQEDVYVVMGAPDILLHRANIKNEELLQLESWIEETSREGKRLIGIAKFTPKHKNHRNFKVEDVEGLTFLGMFAFYDPIRPEVPEAIKNIESHGLKMVLVTGDLVGTALSVSRSLKWEVFEEEVLTGLDLKKLTDKELSAKIPRIKIFARVTPEDKLRIGKLYQSLGEIVAMTGDGVNDAPALKAMDVGISLGSGSDVAKSAADIVLLNDNLQTISLCIDEGRKILSNIRKAFVFLMSNSFDEVFIIGGSLIAGLALPLTALQIIWVNLVTGSLPALAFAFEEDIDKQKYKGRDLRLIFTKEVKLLTFGIGIFSSLLLFLLYYFMREIDIDLELARSFLFVCFSSYILAIAFSFRSLYHPLFSYPTFSNKKLNWSILIATFLLILTMTVPFMREIFKIAPLPLSSTPFIALWLVLNVLLIEGAKYLMRKSLDRKSSA